MYSYQFLLSGPTLSSDMRGSRWPSYADLYCNSESSHWLHVVCCTAWKTVAFDCARLSLAFSCRSHPPRHFGGSLTPEIDGFLRLSCGGFRRLFLASHVPDPECGRYCSLRHLCDSLRSFSARQSNRSEESVSRPADCAPCANLDGKRGLSLPGPLTDLQIFPL